MGANIGRPELEVETTNSGVTPSANRALAVVSSGVGDVVASWPPTQASNWPQRASVSRTVTRTPPMAVCGAVKWAPLA